MESQPGNNIVVKHNSNNNHSNSNNINNNTANANHTGNIQTQTAGVQQQQQPQQNVVASAPSFTPASNNNQNVNIALQAQPHQQQAQQQNNNVIAPAPAFTPTPLTGVGSGIPSVPVPVAAAGHHLYNPSLPNIYVPATGMPQPGSMYPMISTHIPSNVYVNNVTANVNLHSWPHTMSPYMQSGAPQYVHSEVSPDQNGPVMQAMPGMPVALAPTNAIVGPGNVNSSGPSNISGRGSRRGRGRGGSGGSRRGDYNNQRHPPPEGSPVPQAVQQGQDTMSQSLGQQPQQHPAPQPIEGQLMGGGSHAYAPHQYAHTSPYPYAFPAYFPQNAMIHPAQAAAQQAAGTPLYVPVYANAHQVYGCMGGSFMYPYHPFVSADDGQGDDRQNPEGMIWHTQQVYTEEYGINSEIHGNGGEELNHSAPSLDSSETPSMLSPNYPIYGQPIHDMQQQMGMMQIYDEPQMGQMPGIHSGASVAPQIEDELGECGTQSSAIQIVPAGAIIAAAPMTISNEPQLLHHGHAQHPAPPHHILQPAVIGMEPQLVAAQPQQLAAAPDHVIVESGINSTQINEITSLQSVNSMSSLNEINQQSTENIAEDYQQQSQQPPQHVQQVQQQQIVTELNEVYNNNSQVVMTDGGNDLMENVPNSENKAVAPTTFASVVSTQQQQIQTSPPSHKYSQPQPPPPQQQQQQQPQKAHQPAQQSYNKHEQLVQQHSNPQQQQTQQQQQHIQQQQQNQPFEQRRQQLTYNNTQSRRKYTSDYNSNSNNIHQQQHQPHVPSNSNTNSDSSIQTTKSMSWTNSSQHKKSTASVAVTATPTLTNNNNGSSNNNNVVVVNKQSSSYSHTTKTFTNQQHYHQQQNYHPHQHHQQQNYYNQPQTRNHSAMKTPLSPVNTDAPPFTNNITSNASATSITVVTNASAAERKDSQGEQPKVNNANNSSTVSNITNNAINNNSSGSSNTSTPAATSTASTTATPQQFPLQSQTQSQSQLQQQQQQSQRQQQPPATAVVDKQYPGFISGKRAAAAASMTTTSNNAAPGINMAPPASTVNTTSSPAGGSWASLFDKSNNNTVGNTSSVKNSQSASSNSSNNNIINSFIDSPALSSHKPIAMVAPIVTPGGMSYSAASAQGITQPPAAPKPAKPESTTNNAAAIARKNGNLDEYTVKLAEFLTKAKTDLSAISLRPRGLTNPSNYCYINSILQALLGCAPFYNLMRSIPKQAAALSEVKTPTINAMITFMSNFSSQPSGLKLRTNRGPKNKDDVGTELQCDFAFEPNDIYRLWIDSRKEYVEGRQEDAEEFLGYVLNKLNDEMLEVIKLIAKPNAEQNGQSENEDGDEWQMICNNRNKGSITRQTDFGRTPLSDIFRGELRSRLQREGEHSTDDIQPFFTLQLNIEKAASVKEALEILVGRDQLEGVTGSKTKQEVVAWQQMTLEKLPVILILHLKWFDYRSDGCTKILKKVEFPIDLKIDAKILASKKYSQKQRAYRLFAVVYHEGKEATKGHYITDVYHTGYSSWLRYNDSSVKPVSENEVLYPKTPRVPYLLYYRRCDTMSPQIGSAPGNNNASYMNSNHSGRERDVK